ncbi:uncharacterized protein LOC113345773 [Papaver somniferum]|uniref:uncharacterized protein LOC113345773 n=1 Tax=Papaver somniferum TaxID=3469 RepID=UPI000E703A2F|nr:uncharacterized protein LOC113345773 [Papaver somniferum]
MILTSVSDPSSSNQGHAKTTTFADKVKERKTLIPTTVDLTKLSNPTLREGELALEIPSDYFQEGFKPFQHSLIARLDFTGIKFHEVKKNLEEQWQLGLNMCKFLPMSKGFFTIMLNYEEAKKKIHDTKWFVNQQPLRVSDWYPGFSPEKQRTSHAAVWLRFPGLPVELWSERTLLAMEKVIGAPIMVDEKTPNLEYGHFASVLVDIDFGKHVPDRIHIITGGRSFWQYLDIPNYPKFCLHCNIIGHTEEECKKKPTDKNNSKETARTGSGENQPKQVWQDAKNKKNRNKKNKLYEGETPLELVVFTEEENAVLEKSKQFEDKIAQSEADIRAATAKLERTKQAASEHAVLVSKIELARTKSLEAKSWEIVEFERTKQSPTDKNIATSSTPLSNAIEESTIVLSPNRFNVLSDELGLNNHSEGYVADNNSDEDSTQNSG